MEELEHFSHDHLLILRRDYMEDDDAEVYCYGCERSVSGLSYGCTRCKFFLHKSCAELPHQITHHSHPEHLLTLLPKPPYDCYCDLCRENCDRFVYNCSLCRFDVDIRCASVVNSIQQRIQHKSHTHQLISLQKPAMFFCDACGTKHEDTSYLCTTCGFWVSQKCADSLPSTVKLSNHDHPLTLLYSLPFEYYTDRPDCKICDKPVYSRNWVYYCSDSECRYFVHINCAASETKHSMNCKIETEHKDFDPTLIKLNSDIATSNTELLKLIFSIFNSYILFCVSGLLISWLQSIYLFFDFRDCNAEIKVENRITLPANESVDLITLFINDIKLVGKYKGATEITHFSHDHTLYFSNKQIDQESYTKSNLPLLNEVKNGEKCNGCSQRISAPFYHCVQCNFFLHEFCAELPSKLHHPCHLEHPLLLTTNFHLYVCDCCYLPCNSFKYGCDDCEFYLDIKCASLPRIIRHEAHKHTLVLRPRRSKCSACGDWSWYKFEFICDHCKINICVRCALLPPTVRHRYDEHPFTLTYSHLPLKDQDVDDNYESYCEICEGEIDLKLWYYHCGNCDQSLHTKCICPPVDWDSNIKDGVTFNIEDHPQHLLTLVPSPKDRYPKCSRCNFSLNKFSCFRFECGPCNYWICYNCGQQLANK